MLQPPFPLIWKIKTQSPSRIRNMWEIGSAALGPTINTCWPISIDDVLSFLRFNQGLVGGQANVSSTRRHFLPGRSSKGCGCVSKASMWRCVSVGRNGGASCRLWCGSWSRWFWRSSSPTSVGSSPWSEAWQPASSLSSRVTPPTSSGSESNAPQRSDECLCPPQVCV